MDFIKLAPSATFLSVLEELQSCPGAPKRITNYFAYRNKSLVDNKSSQSHRNNKNSSTITDDDSNISGKNTSNDSNSTKETSSEDSNKSKEKSIEDSNGIEKASENCAETEESTAEDSNENEKTTTGDCDGNKTTTAEDPNGAKETTTEDLNGTEETTTKDSNENTTTGDCDENKTTTAEDPNGTKETTTEDVNGTEETATGDQSASELLLLTSDVKWCHEKMRERGMPHRIHELINQSQVILPAYKPTTRSPELEARIQRLRNEQANLEYKRMTKNITYVRGSASSFSSLGAEMREMHREINRQIVTGIQYIVSIVGTFFALYVCMGFTTDEFGTRLIIAIIGALVVGVAEIYFIIREDMREESIKQKMQ